MSIPEINLLHVNRENIDQQIYFHASILEKLVELRKKYDDEDDEMEDDECEDLIDPNFDYKHKNQKIINLKKIIYNTIIQMALNFENIGTPVAKILDKNKKELNTVYLADLEIHQKPRHIYETIELQANETFQQIPDNRERNILYITGASGSGKSYYSDDYINRYIKKNPNNEIYLFSSVSDDKVLDKIKKLKRVNTPPPRGGRGKELILIMKISFTLNLILMILKIHY